ncbi:MAG: DM13 domain-containing protein [Alphaproteobacteria bacterium]
MTGKCRDANSPYCASSVLSVLPAASGETTVRMINMQVADGPYLFAHVVKELDRLFPEDGSAEFTSLGKLQSLTGTQDYGIPAGVDIDDWGSVVVWCASFTTTFAVATIKPTN